MYEPYAVRTRSDYAVASQLVSSRCDLVYDEAGDVIDRASTRASTKSIPPQSVLLTPRPRRVTDKAHHSLLVNLNDHAWAAGLCVSGAPPASAANGRSVKAAIAWQCYDYVTSGTCGACNSFLPPRQLQQSRSSSPIKRPRWNRSVFSLSTRLAVPRRQSRITHSNEQHGEEKG